MTPAERARWRIWFWLLLLLGPFLALLAFPLRGVMYRALPAVLQPYFSLGSPFVVLGLPVIAALGAAFCLDRSQLARRSNGERIVFTLFMALFFLFMQAAIVFVGCTVLIRTLQ